MGLYRRDTVEVSVILNHKERGAIRAKARSIGSEGAIVPGPDYWPVPSDCVVRLELKGDTPLDLKARVLRRGKGGLYLAWTPPEPELQERIENAIQSEITLQKEQRERADATTMEEETTSATIESNGTPLQSAFDLPEVVEEEPAAAESAPIVQHVEDALKTVEPTMEERPVEEPVAQERVSQQPDSPESDHETSELEQPVSMHFALDRSLELDADLEIESDSTPQHDADQSPVSKSETPSEDDRESREIETRRGIDFTTSVPVAKVDSTPVPGPEVSIGSAASEAESEAPASEGETTHRADAESQRSIAEDLDFDAELASLSSPGTRATDDDDEDVLEADVVAENDIEAIVIEDAIIEDIPTDEVGLLDEAPRGSTPTPIEPRKEVRQEQHVEIERELPATPPKAMESRAEEIEFAPSPPQPESVGSNDEDLDLGDESDDGLLRRARKLLTSLTQQGKQTSIDEPVIDNLREVISDLAREERDQIEAQVRESAQGEIAVLEHKIRRLVRSLEDVEKERDEAREEARRTAENLGIPLPGVVAQRKALAETADPNASRKLELLRALVEDNREFRSGQASNPA